MKKLFYLVALLGWAHLAAAQHTELIGRADLDFSYFGGGGAGGTSRVNIYGRDWGGYTSTNNPYGSRLGLGGGLGVRLLRATHSPLLLVLDLGYAYQRARTTITSVSYVDLDTRASHLYEADGSTYYKMQNISMFAAIGCRLQLGSYRFDLLAGPELATVFGHRETGQGTFNGSHSWATSVSQSNGRALDALLRADLTVWRGRLGLNGSYAWGSAAYPASLVQAGAGEAASRNVRLGLVYRLAPPAAR